MFDASSPPARRSKQATWLDPRLLGGVLLILISLVVGARVVAGADKTVPVYAAVTDLPAGHVIAEDDLQPVRVRLASSGTYVDGAETVVGRVVRRELGKGELVPASVLVASVPGAFRDVSLALKPDHFPSDIRTNDLVDVLATSEDAAKNKRTWTVAKGLEVVLAAESGGSFGSSDSRLVLKVPTELVLPLTAAMRSSEIDVVRVPKGNAGDIGDELAHDAVGLSASPGPAGSSDPSGVLDESRSPVAPPPASAPAPASEPAKTP